MPDYDYDHKVKIINDSHINNMAVHYVSIIVLYTT